MKGRKAIAKANRKKWMIDNLVGPGAEPLHFRVCHFCRHLNESSHIILRCEKCDKSVSFLSQGFSDGAQEQEILGSTEDGVWEAVEVNEDELDGLDLESYPVLNGLGSLF